MSQDPLVPPAEDVRELLRSVDEHARARDSRRATTRALVVSVAIHAVILFFILVTASVVKPPWARWSTPVEAPEGRAAAATAAVDVVAGAEQLACASRGDSIVPELVRYAKAAVSGAAPGTLGLAALPRGDSSQVWYVEVEEKCRRAAATINTAYRQPVNLARTLYLVGTGSAYLVVDTSLARGRYGKSFGMDTALTKIMGW